MEVSMNMARKVGCIAFIVRSSSLRFYYCGTNCHCRAMKGRMQNLSAANRREWTRIRKDPMSC